MERCHVRDGFISSQNQHASGPGYVFFAMFAWQNIQNTSLAEFPLYSFCCFFYEIWLRESICLKKKKNQTSGFYFQQVAYNLQKEHYLWIPVSATSIN